MNAWMIRSGDHGSSRPGLSAIGVFERDRRDPERVHARRVARQDRAEDPALAEVRQRPPVVVAEPAVEDRQVKPARQPGDDDVDLVEDPEDLLRVVPAERDAACPVVAERCLT